MNNDEMGRTWQTRHEEATSETLVLKDDIKMDHKGTGFEE